MEKQGEVREGLTPPEHPEPSQKQAAAKSVDSLEDHVMTRLRDAMLKGITEEEDKKFRDHINATKLPK